MRIPPHSSVSRNARHRPAAPSPGGRAALLQIALLLGLVALPLAAPDAPPAPGLASILVDDLRAHVEYLAGDDMAGRGVGHVGNERASAYVAQGLGAAGLRPTDSGFQQAFSIVSRSLGKESVLAVRVGTGRRLVEERHQAGSDFYPLPASVNGMAQGSIVFAGYGISAAKLGYDDYDGYDVAGRVVIVLRHEPEERDLASRFDGDALSEHASFASKVQAAASRGAAALLVVPDGGHPDTRPRLNDLNNVWPRQLPGRRRRFALATTEDYGTLPVGMISIALADRILAASATAPLRSITSVRQTIDAALAQASPGEPIVAPATFELPDGDVTVRSDVVRDRVEARNALGIIPGSDPALSSQRIVVGAHLDHDGIDARQRIFNGADDNASGTAALLEVAEAMAIAARAGRGPRRTVLFAGWNAEEKGALGSRHFVANTVSPAKPVVAMLNMDMVGRSEEIRDPGEARFRGFRRSTARQNRNVLHLVGYSLSPELASLVADVNASTELTLRMEYDDHVQNLLRRSDHWSFLEHGIPAIFFTTGLHGDYHTPDDDADKIDYEKLARISRLVYGVAWRLANQDVPPPRVDVAARSTR